MMTNHKVYSGELILYLLGLIGFIVYSYFNPDSVPLNAAIPIGVILGVPLIISLSITHIRDHEKKGVLTLLSKIIVVGFSLLLLLASIVGIVMTFYKPIFSEPIDVVIIYYSIILIMLIMAIRIFKSVLKPTDKQKPHIITSRQSWGACHEADAKAEFSRPVKKQKAKSTIKTLIVSSVLIVISLSALYSIFTDFIPNQDYIKQATNFSLSLSAILTVIAYIAFFKNDSQWRRSLRGIQNVWVSVLMIPLVIFMLPYGAITKGIPSLIHEFIDSYNGYESFVVESKQVNYYKKRCTGGVDIDLNLFLGNKACGLPRDMWDEVSVGDTLVLIGKKSIFGLSYDKLRLIKINEMASKNIDASDASVAAYLENETLSQVTELCINDNDEAPLVCNKQNTSRAMSNNFNMLSNTDSLMGHALNPIESIELDLTESEDWMSTCSNLNNVKEKNTVLCD